MIKSFNLFTSIFPFSFLLISCSVETENKKETDSNLKEDSVAVENEKPVEEKTNFIIVPGVSFGDILPNSSEKDLIEIFGKENVIRDSIGVGEGYHVFGTRIFAETKDEITITWVEGSEFKKPEYITVYGIGSSWKTEQGIEIGTTLKQLEKINGGSFTMSGFGWDYAGTVYEWKGGKLQKIAGSDNKYMIIRLGEPPNIKISQEEYFQLMGDDLFESSNDLLQKMNPMVYHMVFTLNQ